MSTKIPGLKNIPPKTDRELKLALDDIKQALEIRLGLRGDPLDRAVTLRELEDSGIVKVRNKALGATSGITPPDEGGPGDTNIPPAPSGLEATGAFTSILLKWNVPSYGNHAFTEIWRSQDNALGGAELVSTSGGQIYTEDVGYNKTYYYWVRFVSTSNIPGPWNDTEGTSAATAVDVGAVMQQLTENLQNLPGYSTLTTLIDTEAAVAARVIKSSSAPTTRADGSALQANDIWYDTDDGQVHTRNSANNAWVAARDATLVNLFGSTSFTGSTLSAAMASAQGNITTLTSANASRVSEINSLTAVVDTKAKTFVQTSAPTATAIGDLWVDSDDNNKLYRASAVGSSNWVAVRDTANDNYPRVFTQANPPTAINTGDLWFDTDDNNKQYRWDGSNWVEVRDVTTQAAVTTEATARASGDSANATLITNLEAKVDVKNQTFIQDNPPTAIAIGDLWIDSNDGNKLYRATATTNSNWVEITLPGTDAGKATIYTQDNVPTSGVKAGDLWFDTNDSNRQYIAAADGSDQVTSGEWEEVRDVTTQAALTAEATTRANADSAEATARGILEAKVDLKNQTFVQNNAPTAVATGDLWVDSNDENKLYRWNGSAWVAVRDTANDGKTTVFTQTSQPTAENTGDLWFDTDDGNKQYRWDGSNWVVVRDVLTQASVTTVQNAVANGTSAEAGYGLSVNANNAIAGMYLMASSDGTLNNNTSSSTILFEAGQVAIRNPHGSDVVPFIVLTSTDADGNAAGVYMDTAFIKNAAITTAKIDDLAVNNAKVTGDLDAGKITAGTMSALRIQGGVIQSTDLASGSSTTIHGSLIETGTILANAIVSGSFISPSDVGQSGSTTIHGDRIATGTIDADKIDVTDLVLPTVHSKVTGATIGGFLSNQMTVQEVGSIGTENGIYDGFVRIFGGSGQVKTLSFFIGDGTFGSSGEIDSDAGTYNNAPNTQNLPMVDSGGVQYHSNRAEAWAGIARFQTTQAVCQLSVSFRKRSGTSKTAKLYILAQGDGGTRFLSNVEYSFSRLALNEPAQFSFTPVTGAAVSTTITSAAVTISGSGFSSGTITASGFGSPKISIGTGSFLAGSQTITDGQSIRIQMTTGSQNSQAFTSTATIGGVSANFVVTTVAGTPPPSPPGPGSPGGPGGPGGPPSNPGENP